MRIPMQEPIPRKITPSDNTLSNPEIHNQFQFNIRNLSNPEIFNLNSSKTQKLNLNFPKQKYKTVKNTKTNPRIKPLMVVSSTITSRVLPVFFVVAQGSRTSNQEREPPTKGLYN